MSGFFGKMAAMFSTSTDTNAEGGEAGEDTALALAALMVRLARSDGAYEADEKAAIEAALDARYGNAADLLARAEKAEADALDSHQFTRLVKDAVAHEDRGALLEDLWSVVLADGERDKHEDALMRQFASLLHVSDREAAEARQRVLARG
ncbi:MAG: TerB family tellurite resistance protein [Pikeienuella sp.]